MSLLYNNCETSECLYQCMSCTYFRSSCQRLVRWVVAGSSNNPFNSDLRATRRSVAVNLTLRRNDLAELTLARNLTTLLEVVDRVSHKVSQVGTTNQSVLGTSDDTNAESTCNISLAAIHIQMLKDRNAYMFLVLKGEPSSSTPTRSGLCQGH